jgi:hypothetical protein
VAAKLRGPSEPIRIAFYGDSNLVGEGSGTSTLGLFGAREKGFAIVLAKSLGWQTGTFYGDQNVATGSVTLEQFDPRIVLGSFASDAAASTAGGRFIVCSGASSQDFQFTPESAFDEFSFKYPQTSTANTSISVKVDGNVIDTFSQAGANTYKTKKYTVAKGIHTIQIQSTGTGTAFIHGIETRDTASSAPIFLHLGWCGAKWADLNSVSGAYPWAPRNALVALAPDCVLTHCTINDISASTPIATVVGHMSGVALAVTPVATLMHTVSFPANRAGMYNGTLQNYADNLKYAALSFEGSYADARCALSNDWNLANAKGWTYDNDHPSEAGHALIAGLFKKLFSCIA